MGMAPSGVHPPIVPMVEGAAKPVETWAVNVASSNKQLTGKEVATKVMKDNGPHLNVRVNEVKALKGDGTVIRTPSDAEREKVASKKKFKETGLVVKVEERLFTALSPETFM